MKYLKAYCVTKDSSDKTFQCGTIIWLSPNGDINTIDGALPVDDQVPESIDFECEEANDWKVTQLGNREHIEKIG